MDRAVWNIIRTQMSNDLDGTAGADDMVDVGIVPDTSGGVPSVNEDGEAVQQIIYVSYQDPDDPSESHTLHIVDDVAAATSDVCNLTCYFIITFMLLLEERVGHNIFSSHVL